MPHRITGHEVLAAVFQVRGLNPHGESRNPHFTCCCGSVHSNRSGESGPCRAADFGDDEDLTSSVRRQLAEKVDLREVAHLEQLAVFSDQAGCPGTRTIASTFLGLVPSPASPNCLRTRAGTR